MNIKIESSEAKTKLPELLRGVKAGNHYTITSRGKPVADLRPVESAHNNDPAGAVEQMRELMLSANLAANINIKALIAEGRA